MAANSTFGTHWVTGGELLNASATVYTCAFASAVETDGSIGGTARLINDSGVLAELFIRVTSNSINNDSFYTAQDDGVDTSLSVTITANTDGDYEDASNEPSITAPDDVNFEATGGAGGTSLLIRLVSCEFRATTDAVSLFGCNSSGTGGVGDATIWLTASGNRSLFSTESSSTGQTAEWWIEEAGVWQDMGFRSGNNTRISNVTIQSNINAAVGNQTLTFTPTDSNTWKEDTSNTDTLTAGDKIQLECTPAAADGGTLTVEKSTGSLVTTDGDFAIGALHGNDERIEDNVTAYWPFCGEMGVEHTATTNVAPEMPFDFTLQDLRAKISRMVGTVSVTYKSYDADTPGVGNLSVALSATGEGQDTSNSDSLLQNEKWCYQISSPVGGTNYDTQYISVGGNVAVGGGGLGIPIAYHHYRTMMGA